MVALQALMAILVAGESINLVIKIRRKFVLREDYEGPIIFTVHALFLGYFVWTLLDPSILLLTSNGIKEFFISGLTCCGL